MLQVNAIDLHYGAAQALRARLAHRRARQGDLRARPQRRRQDQPARRAGRPAADQQRHDHLGRRRHFAAQARRARPPRHRLCAAGPRDLPAAHGRGEPQDRLCAAQARRALDPGRRVLAVPGARRHAAPARRRPVGRPAAAARHRPRAGDAAAAAAAGRADRGHPALDHQGYRPRHRAICAIWGRSPWCWSSNISTLRASWATISP